MKSVVFFDSNVPLYLFSNTADKAAIAERLLEHGGVVSVQVLNELVDVARRKFRAPWPAIDDFLSTIRGSCSVVPVTLDAHDRALAISKRHQIRIYDATILSSALEAGADTLYSEDLQAGRSFSGLTIRNPFHPA